MGGIIFTGMPLHFHKLFEFEEFHGIIAVKKQIVGRKPSKAGIFCCENLVSGGTPVYPFITCAVIG